MVVGGNYILYTPSQGRGSQALQTQEEEGGHPTFSCCKDTCVVGGSRWMWACWGGGACFLQNQMLGPTGGEGHPNTSPTHLSCSKGEVELRVIVELVLRQAPSSPPQGAARPRPPAAQEGGLCLSSPLLDLGGGGLPSCAAIYMTLLSSSHTPPPHPPAPLMGAGVAVDPCAEGAPGPLSQPAPDAPPPKLQGSCHMDIEAPFALPGGPSRPLLLSRAEQSRAGLPGRAGLLESDRGGGHKLAPHQFMMQLRFSVMK